MWSERNWGGFYPLKMFYYLKAGFEECLEVNRTVYWENHKHLVLLLTPAR